MTMDHDFKILIDQIGKRLDNHGLDIRDMRDKLDNKMDKALMMISQYKEADGIEHKGFNTRLTKIESERGIFGKILQVIVGFAAGTGGGWFGKHL